MVIFNEEKIKYECLDNLILDVFTDIRFTQTVNVIIDLKEVFKKVFRPNVFPENITKIGNLTQEITSDIIGIVSHYRNYFFKHGKYSTFYFLYSNSECELLKEKYSNYKKEHYEKYYRENETKLQVKEKVLKALTLFLKSIPNVFVVDCSEFDDVACLKFLKNKIPENQFTLLLSNDSHWFQILSVRNILALNCKGIKSTVIRASDALNYISKQEERIKFSSLLLPLVLAISGSPKYSLSSIKGIGTSRAINIVSQLLSSGKVQDTEYMEFPIKKELLDEKIKNEKILLENFEELKRNYEVISCNDILYSNEIKLSQLFNISKPSISANKLMDINSKLFANYPINLDMLLKGEKLK